MNQLFTRRPNYYCYFLVIEPEIISIDSEDQERKKSVSTQTMHNHPPLQSIILDNEDPSDQQSYQSNNRIKYSYPFPTDKKDLSGSGQSYTHLHIEICSPEAAHQVPRKTTCVQYLPSSPIYDAQGFGQKTTGYPAWKDNYSKQEISTMFQIIDADKDGYIGEGDIELFLDLIGEEYTREEVEEMIMMLDPHDGIAPEIEELSQLLSNFIPASEVKQPDKPGYTDPKSINNPNSQAENKLGKNNPENILKSSPSINSGFSPLVQGKRIGMKEFTKLFTNECYIGLGRSYSRSPRDLVKSQIYQQLNKNKLDLTDPLASQNFINCLNQALHVLNTQQQQGSGSKKQSSPKSAAGNKAMNGRRTSSFQNLGGSVSNNYNQISGNLLKKPEAPINTDDIIYTSTETYPLTRPKYTQSQHQQRKQMFQSTIKYLELGRILQNYTATNESQLNRREIAQMLLLSPEQPQQQLELNRLYVESQEKLNPKVVILEVVAYSMLPRMQRIQKALQLYSPNQSDIDFEELLNFFSLISAHDERLRAKLQTIFKKKELTRRGRIEKEIVLQIVAEYGSIFSL